jgi:hypothetical protein
MPPDALVPLVVVTESTDFRHLEHLSKLRCGCTTRDSGQSIASDKCVRQ